MTNSSRLCEIRTVAAEAQTAVDMAVSKIYNQAEELDNYLSRLLTVNQQMQVSEDKLEAAVRDLKEENARLSATHAKALRETAEALKHSQINRQALADAYNLKTSILSTGLDITTSLVTETQHKLDTMTDSSRRCAEAFTELQATNDRLHREAVSARASTDEWIKRYETLKQNYDNVTKGKTL